MPTETVTCSACGAPLSIPDNAEYVACRYCQAQLHVQRSQSVVFTEVLQSLQKQTERLADNTEVLRLQNEIAMLDREWEQKTADLMVRGKHGRVSVPDKTSAIVGGVFLTLFGLFWTVMAGAIFPPMALFGILFIIFGVMNCMRIHSNAERYELLQASHDRKRRDLKSRLREIDRGE